MKAYSYEEKKATAHIGMIGTNVLILFAFSLLVGILFCEFVCHKNITIYQGPVCGSLNYLFCKQSVTAFLMDHTIFSGSSERTGHGYRYASVLSGRIFLWKAFCDNVCDRIVDSIFVLSA